MGEALQRTGQILTGAIIAVIGYGFQYGRAWAEALIPASISQQAPIQVPQLLTYASWVLYAIGGIITFAGIAGLIGFVVRTTVRDDTEEPPAEPRQRPQDGRGQPRQGGYQGQGGQQRNGTGQPRSRGQGPQPVDDDRNRR